MADALVSGTSGAIHGGSSPLERTFQLMDSLFKIKIILLCVILMGQSGCATSDSDLGYTRKTMDNSAGDNSYHGWTAPPKETSQ